MLTFLAAVLVYAMQLLWVLLRVIFNLNHFLYGCLCDPTFLAYLRSMDGCLGEKGLHKLLVLPRICLSDSDLENIFSTDDSKHCGNYWPTSNLVFSHSRKYKVFSIWDMSWLTGNIAVAVVLNIWIMIYPNNYLSSLQCFCFRPLDIRH